MHIGTWCDDVCVCKILLNIFDEGTHNLVDRIDDAGPLSATC